MNKTLRLALALVLALVMVFALTACEQHECESKCEVCGKCMDAECTEKVCAEKCEGHQDSPDVPTEEGKFTWFLTLSEESLEIPSYVSIFVTGGATNWATGVDAIELRPLEGTNVWYAISDYDPEDTPAEIEAQKLEYGAVLGYNATSGLGASAQGLQWVDSYKSNECLAFAYPTNAAFTVDGNKINLGTHTFATVPGAPTQLEKVTFTVELAEALPEGWEVLMPGSHTGWNNKYGDHLKMTPSEDRKTWSLTVSNLTAGEYVYKILAAKVGSQTEGEDIGCWSNLTVGATEANESIELTGMDNNNVVALRGEPASFPESLFTAAKLDQVTFKVELTEALPEGWVVVMPGSHVGWNNTHGEHLTMTTDAERKVWKLTVEGLDEGTYEYKILAAKADATGDLACWSNRTEGMGDANEKVSITYADNNGEVALRAEPATFPASLFAVKTPVENVTIVVKLAKALPEGYTLYLPGTITSWEALDHPMTKSEDGLTWTLTIASTMTGSYECQAVAVTEGQSDAWAHKAQAENIVFEITAEDANGQIVVIENVTYTIGE